MKSRNSSTAKARVNGSSPRAQDARQSEQGTGAETCSRDQMIAVAAYFRAQQRGFTPDNELADWLQAEAEVEEQLRRH